MRKSILLAALLAFSQLAHADRLDEARARGTLLCGVFSGAPPFAYQDPSTRDLKGYDVDICKAIGGKMGLKTEIKLVSLEARIPELQQGRIDVLAAVLGYSPARAEQIAFSDTYFLGRQVVAVKTAGPFSKLGDLDGKRISTIKGSSSIPIMQKALPAATPVAYDIPSAAFTALMQDKVDGMIATEVALRSLMQKLGPDASQLKIVEPPVVSEHWGLGIRKGEPALEKAVNDALLALEKSGELDTIFNRAMGPDTEYKLKRNFNVAPIPR
jgi:polar amino acid transport system substrate-binding protein